jgi:hypothetical protein
VELLELAQMQCNADAMQHTCSASQCSAVQHRSPALPMLLHVGLSKNPEDLTCGSAAIGDSQPPTLRRLAPCWAAVEPPTP